MSQEPREENFLQGRKMTIISNATERLGNRNFFKCPLDLIHGGQDSGVFLFLYQVRSIIKLDSSKLH